MQASASPHRAAASPARVDVTATCFDDVARVMGLLRGRRYEVIQVDADRRTDGSWTVGLTVAGGPHTSDLLCRRLDRLPGITQVRNSGGEP